MRSLIVWSTLIFALGHQSAFAAPTNERVSVVFGKGCNIAVTLPHTRHGGIGNGGDPDSQEGGMEVNPLPASWKSNMGRMYFSLNCRDLDDPFALPTTGRFDEGFKKWVKDETSRINFILKMPIEDQQTQMDSLATNRFYNIQAINAQGWAETEDDVTGDERYRPRRMGFCIWNPPKAICGEGITGYLIDPKSDLTERALEIIRTIEFLPDVPAAPPVKP